MRGFTFNILPTAKLSGGRVVTESRPNVRAAAPNPLRAQLFRKTESTERRPSARYIMRGVTAR